MKKSLLLLFGGESSEHDISIMSAKNVYGALDTQKYNVYLGYIDKKGAWWLLDEWTDELDSHSGAALLVKPGSGCLVMMPGATELPIDIIFPVLHGKNGEDGTVQGLAEMAHIPYVGCGIEASVLGMDKVMAKKIVESSSEPIKVADYAVFDTIVEASSFVASGELQKQLGDGPWFVKPARAGSSVGVSRATSEDEFIAAVQTALRHDNVALAEKAITGREVEVAVLGNPPHHQASGVGEIITGEMFYSYEEKYSSASATQTTIESDLPSAIKEDVRRQALIIYQLLSCRGLARVDFFVTADNEIYFNEINTMPGFTNISMYPQLWQAQGIDYAALVDRLLRDAFSQ